MAVIELPHRLPPDAKVLKKIEKGTLEHFDVEAWDNLNTGVLEEYLEEKNRRDAFKITKWDWKKVGIGIAIGTVFALITQYVGLKVGIAIAGSWYVALLIAISFKWNPAEANMACGASTGATYICTGFIFTFPAMYLLMYDPYYATGSENGEPIMLINHIPSMTIPLIATIISGFLGVMYFIIFRRVWLIEDPLHVPGIEANLKLLEIANDVSKGAAESARHAIKLVGVSTGLTALLTFFKDFPLGAKDEPIFDRIFGGRYYHESVIMQPYDSAKYTWLSFGIIPIQIGIGWFMRFRVALLVTVGTFVTWFLIIPMAVGFEVPIYIPLTDSFHNVRDFSAPSLIAYKRIARIIAIGAILGGGVTALIKMLPVFKTATADLFKAFSGEKGGEYEEGRGWYEWPMSHIFLMAGMALVTITIVFWLGDYPFLESFVFSILLVATTFFLGAIAVKVMGETGTEPVSGTSFIVLISLVLLFKYGLGTSKETTAVMAIIGTTVFGGAISMSGDIIYDFKAGLFVGNRPYHLMKGELTGIIPGAIVSVIGAKYFGEGLGKGELTLAAPQARAFATVLQILVGGETVGFILQLLVLGIIIGIIAEITTGMGTAFGLGMYFPLFLSTPMLLGGALRDLWETKWLEPKAKEGNWTDKQKTLKRLDTYMIATGLIVGEAVMGTIIALYIVGVK